MNIWALADHRPGNVTQIVGVASALRRSFEIKSIEYNRLGALPNGLLGASVCGITKGSRKQLEAPYPNLIIGAGRRTAPVALYIKKQAEKAGQTPPKLVQIMNPGSMAKQFDLVAVPRHDQMPPAQNIIETITAPHKVTKQTLADARKEWKNHFKDLSNPRISVLIGGKNKSKDLSLDQIREFLSLTEKLAYHHNASLMITTSRRTSEAATQLIKDFTEETSLNCFVHLWHHDACNNPYMGLMAWGDMFVITGDSVSMLSEASITGKPIFIYAPDGSCGPSHRRLHSSLYETSVARSLTDQNFDKWSYTPPNAALDIAQEIRTRFC